MSSGAGSKNRLSFWTNDWVYIYATTNRKKRFRKLCLFALKDKRWQTFTRIAPHQCLVNDFLQCHHTHTHPHDLQWMKVCETIHSPAFFPSPLDCSVILSVYLFVCQNVFNIGSRDVWNVIDWDSQFANRHWQSCEFFACKWWLTRASKYVDSSVSGENHARDKKYIMVWLAVTVQMYQHKSSDVRLNSVRAGTSYTFNPN